MILQSDQTNSSTPLAGSYSKTDPSEAFAQAVEEGVALGLAQKKRNELVEKFSKSLLSKSD